MKNRLKNILSERNINMFLEGVYLMLLILWVAYYFLGTTTFDIVWPDHFYNNLQTVIIAVVFVRVAYGRRYHPAEILIVAVLIIVFNFAVKRNGYDSLICTLLMIIGARGISFRKLIKVYFVTTAILFLYTIGAALFGYTENLVYAEQGRRARIAFGIVYPTDFSAHVFYGILAYFYIRGERLKYIEMGVAAATGVFVYWFCDARLNTICIFGAVALFVMHRFARCRSIRAGKIYEMNSAVSGILAISTTICACIMIGLTIFYSSSNRWMVLLDDMITSRLRLGYKGLSVYGFSLWGKYIEQRGMGGAVGSVKHYFFLDSSYTMIALQCGLIVLGVVLLIWLLIGIKAKARRDWILLLIIGVIAVQCMIEHHMLEVAYNPFLWALLADIGTKDSTARLGRLPRLQSMRKKVGMA